MDLLVLIHCVHKVNVLIFNNIYCTVQIVSFSALLTAFVLFDTIYMTLICRYGIKGKIDLTVEMKVCFIIIILHRCVYL